MTRPQFQFTILNGMAAGLLQLTITGAATAQAAREAPSPTQPTDTSPTAPSSAAAPVPTTADEPKEDTTTATAPAATDAPVDRITALEQKLDAQTTRVDELEDAVSTLNEQLTSADGESSEDRRLSAWGFFDVTFGRTIFDNSHALYGLGTPRKWSFMTNGINLYLKSEMTQTLSAMVETRLTFTPVGSESDFNDNIYIGGKYAQSEGNYVRGWTNVKSPYAYYMYRQHGLVIERAHVDWKPKDWLGFRAGYFLTPFGIWNEDHGSPTVLGVDMPNLINYALVPIHQMGIEVYGSRLLTDSLNLEYAVTLSNGRGAMDEYKDLDNNKAVGLRGKLVYSTDDWLLRVGGYAYYGRYTDSTNWLDVWLTPTLTLDRSHVPSLGSSSPISSTYRETVGTLEAMVQFKGFKVMGELAKRRVIYDVAPHLPGDVSLLNNIPYGTTVYAAGFNGIAYYALAAYEYDLGESLGNVKVTPYVGADHLSPDKTAPYLDMNQYRAGLNVKPSPYVTTKLEAMRVVPRATEMTSKAWFLYVQTAVSF